MLPIVALIASVTVILFIVFAAKRKNQDQDLGDEAWQIKVDLKVLRFVAINH